MPNVEKLLSAFLKDNFHLSQDTSNLFIEIGGSSTPIIGSIWTGIRLNRMNKRLKSVESKLLTIVERIELSKNTEFYKMELFPMILKHLYDEDEDEKIHMYINGFEYSITEGIHEKERVFHYFDVFSELRVSDMVHLLSKYHKRNLNYIKMEIPDVKRMYEDKEYREEIDERKGINTYIDNKLTRLGLIYLHDKDPIEKIDDLLQKGSSYSRIRHRPTYLLTNFGSRFITFFTKEQ